VKIPAPIAAALKSLVRYLDAWLEGFDASGVLMGAIALGDLLAILLVWGLVWVQLRGTGLAIRMNDLATLSKLAGIVLIILAAALVGQGDIANFSHVSDGVADMDASTRFAAIGTSLIFVMFCYSGWNAAAYVASEIVEPQRNLPRALLAGTAIVTLLYLLLNAVYIYGANVDALAGKVEVGLVAARALFGPGGAGLVTIVLSVSLLASASAMTIAGPRVSYALGRDVPELRGLARKNRHGTPVVAAVLQGTVASAMIVSGTVDQILQYAGFTLALVSALAVSCVIVLRFTQPDLERPFRVWAYPLPPLFYIVVTGWTMFWAFAGRPGESSLALATVLTGGIVFQLRRLFRTRGDDPE
jgi:APA family basic amino acid/polyamine antiporter